MSLLDPYGENTKPEHKRLTRLKVRCGNCGRLLAERVTAPWTIKCSRCKCVNESAPSIPAPKELSEEAALKVTTARKESINNSERSNK